MKLKRVVVVGAGFGGLNAAKILADQSDLEVIVIDRRNYHLFQPLLYQVATAGLSPADIAVPIRGEFRAAKNVGVHMGEINRIDFNEKRVISNHFEFTYDYLILACGAQHSYFGKSEWEEFAPGLKTLEQATEIRRRVLLAFEMAENECDAAIQNEWLTFVVVGGGPTGVEIAGALAEISRSVLIKDFRRIHSNHARIILVEAGSRILPSFTEDLSIRAKKDLEALGVEVLLNNKVTGVDSSGVDLGNQKTRSRTVIWAAGVQPSSLNQKLNLPLDRFGRVIVEKDLSLKNLPNVFVIGDQSHFELKEGEALPGLAPVAIQQGRAAARNILRDLKGQPRLEFKYYDKGQMATIGKKRAVAEIGRLHMTGIIAWLAWLFIHLLYLVGFHNRTSVFREWIWNYIFSKRNARLISTQSWRSFDSDRQKDY
jgi:NADH dehydrogenase